METIAIIGMGCRFPGAKDPESFWELLHQGVNAVTEVPPKRWEADAFYNPNPVTPAKMNTRWGGFVEDIEKFDASFFNISPRETEHIDPQQRLVLEVAWEALENAGIVPEKLAGTQTGVFVGIGSYDYHNYVCSDLAALNAYSATGTSNSVAANRLSYLLDLRGPSVAIDTACSSSLVAVHYACQSLRLQETDLCIVGGVNIVLTTDVSITLSQARMMSPDGCCKTFDKNADGYVRGEGCGVVVLKRFADACKDGDKIIGVIKGSAVNQDGLSNGLTAPNGPAQQVVIQKALDNAGVTPAEISYVEAHGTGTSLGDPIEVRALGTVFAKQRLQEEPLFVGSVKTNIGHLEAAAGMAGLIKVVLALQHEIIPPNLHFQEPSPYINWAELPAVTIPTEPTAWLRTTKPRLAGVSSFGFGGTNAHVVLVEAPAETPVISELERDWHLLTLSAKNETALQELAQKYEKFLIKNSQASLADICFTANTSRTRFDYRLSVVAASNLHLREQLNAFVANEKIAGLVSGKISGRKRQKIAFLFTGQGSQYVGMGRQLYEQAPVFRQTLQKCDEILRSYLEESIINILYSSDGETSLIDQTAYTQPALFALEYSLYQLWQSLGVKPNALIGHSVGEYVAACIAGVFSLEDGLKLIATRGRLMQGLPTTGEMVAVMASADDINNIVDIDQSQVAIAAYNSPNNTVISGDNQAIQAISATLKAAGIKTTKLQTSHAFHSPLMQPILAEFQKVAATITYNPAQIDIISNVTGEKLSPTAINAEYWCEHLRSSVKFAQSIATLDKQGYEIYVELGAKPTLLSMGRSCLANSNTLWLASLRPGQEDWQTILDSLGQLYVRGVAIACSFPDQNYSTCQITLPTYPFQRQRYWPEIRTAEEQVASANNPQLHPLLGHRIHSALKEIQFESQISPKATAFLQQHQIFGKTVLPATAYIEMVLAAGQQILPSQQLIVEDISIQQALLLTDKAQTLQLILTPMTAGVYTWQIFCQNSTAENTQPTWTLQVTGKLRQGAADTPPAKTDIAKLLAECNQQITLPEYYEQFRQRGVDYGESFQGISQLWQHAEFALGEIHLPEALQKEAQLYQLHPALLDACLQVLAAALPAELHDYSYMTVGIQQLRVYQQLTHPLWSYAKLHLSVNGNYKILTGDIELLNLQGEVIATVEGLELQQTTAKAVLGSLTPETAAIEDWLYQVEWRSQTSDPANQVREDLPTPAAIKAQLQPHLAPIIAQTQLEDYKLALSQLENLSIAYVLQAFTQLGWRFSLQQQFTVETLAQKLGIDTQHLRLLARLLEMLAEVGILQQQQAQWQVQKLPELIEPQSQMNWLLTNYPIVNTELTLLERCGSQLASVLRGECDPLQLLFPGGDFSITTQLYEKSPVAQVMNILVQKILVTVLVQTSHGRKLRILEIGAGTGGTTSHILPYLSTHEVEYTFTDVSAIFLFKAQQKFRDYPFVQYQILDIEQDPLAQEFVAHEYDVIVAANVLHVAGNLRNCVENIKQLLTPGGMLVLLEGTQPMRWLDLIFGLTKGWWQFKDFDLRPAYPLLSSHKWQQLLRETGFDTVESLPGNEYSQGALSKQAVIVAQVNPVSSPIAEVAAKSWLILADETGVGQQLVSRLESQGQVCTLVFLDQAYSQVGEREYTVNPNSPQDFHQLIQAVTTTQPDLFGVVHCWSLNASTADLAVAAQLGCGSTLYLVQALVDAKFARSPGVWLVTRGAVPAGNSQVSGLAQSPLWGMGKVIALEHPELNCVLIDLDPDIPTAAAVSPLFQELCSPNADKETQLAFRQEKSYITRLVHCRKLNPLPLQLQSDASYLITGGLGGIGLLVAQWMVEHGAKHLCLLGRTIGSDAARETIEHLKKLGVQILIAQADVSKIDQVAEVLTQIEQSMPQLRGIIHTAGVFEDRLLQEHKSELFTKVFAPKIDGSWNLHILTQNRPLDFFVLFSSFSSIFGGAGLSNYVAANTFLDALANYRQQLNLPALSINWGPWQKVGMAEAVGSKREGQWLARGIDLIQPQQGLKVLEHLLLQDTAHVGVLSADWTKLIQQFQLGGDFLFLSDLVEEMRQQTEFAQQPTANLELLYKLKTVNASESYLLITDYIQSVAAQVLGLSKSLLDVQQPLSDVGIDSLMAVELRLKVKQTLDVDVPVVKFIEGLSVASLAEYVNEQLVEAQSQPNISVATYAFSQSQKNGSENGVITTTNAENKVWFGEEAIGDSEWIEGEI